MEDSNKYSTISIIYIVFVFVVILLYLRKKDRGIANVSLIESVTVISSLLLLTLGVIYIFEPLKSLEYTRNIQRRVDISQISSSIKQYIANQDFNIKSIEGLPECPVLKTIGTGPGLLDLNKILSPDFISTMPYDPQNGSPENTGYSICSTSELRIFMKAERSENNEEITVIN